MKSGKNSFFRFKEFTINQDRCGMKVCTDSCILGAMVEPGNAEQILDIGTGTGLLSLMIAQRSLARITGIEINKEAFEQAAENFEASKWKDRLFLAHTTFQKYYESAENKYDLIVSNPPFFSKNLASDDFQRNLALHTSELPFNDLASGVIKLLKDDGRFWVMLPEYESALLENVLGSRGLWSHKKIFIHHSFNKKVLRVITQYGFEKAEVLMSRICIKTPEGEYTEEFKDLLKPYYLIF